MIAPSGLLGNGKSRSQEQEGSKPPFDCAQTLERPALPASGRTSAVIVCHHLTRRFPVGASPTRRFAPAGSKSSLAPLGPSTMGVTAVAVLAIPTTAVIELDARTIVQRSVYRLVGCAFGALMGLFCLYWVGSNFLVWLLLLMAGVWLSSQIQSGTTGIGYVGTQAGLAFLLSMIQGQGPPLSPTPGINRFAGMMAGLTVPIAFDPE
jgi:hypothetical protein